MSEEDTFYRLKRRPFNDIITYYVMKHGMDYNFSFRMLHHAVTYHMI